MKTDKIKYLVGNQTPIVLPLEPYSEVVCDFLDELSSVLRKDSIAKQYADIVSLAFWCRKASVMKMKQKFIDGGIHLGRGIVFHITPSNVPVNFAFSYFFGILSGNSNIVRVPSKEFLQTKIICNAINRVFENNKYKIIKNSTLLISYEKNKEVTDYYSSICDARIIWGGDQAIRNIRQSPLKEKAVEIVFADRYSLAILNSEKIVEATKSELQEISNKFYNDTYLMDQNACSTPHLILWEGKDKELAKKRFWESVFLSSKKYDLEPIKVVDKYTQLCKLAMEYNEIKNISMFENLIYTIDLKQLPSDICVLRGSFGVFFQYDVDNLNQIASYITDKVQSLIYYGVDKDTLINFVMDNHLQGIDRIVALGEALNIGVYWDGYDIVRMLSRQISF
ncbi:MAG: acyl-CoA reductase [Lachnotalea sp.]